MKMHMTYRTLLIFLATVAIAFSAKVRRCKGGNDESEFSIPPIFQTEVVKSLQLQLDFPGEDYEDQFGDNIRTFVGSVEQILQELRDQNVDQAYITTLKGYERGIIDQINNLGSLQDPQRFHQVITDFVNYLMVKVTDLSDYTKTIQDKNVQNYFYSIMLQWLGTRSFLVSSLTSYRCIYQSDKQGGGGPVHGGEGGPGHSGEGGPHHGGPGHGGPHQGGPGHSGEGGPHHGGPGHGGPGHGGPHHEGPGGPGGPGHEGPKHGGPGHSGEIGHGHSGGGGPGHGGPGHGGPKHEGPGGPGYGGPNHGGPGHSGERGHDHSGKGGPGHGGPGHGGPKHGGPGHGGPGHGGPKHGGPEHGGHGGPGHGGSKHG